MAEETKTLTMEQFQEQLTAAVEKTVRDMGLDKIDAKHGMFPTKDDPEGDTLKDLTKEQRIMKFFSAMVNNDYSTVKALSEGTAADGGYMVPTEFRNTMIQRLTKISKIRPRAQVIPMGSDKLDVPVEGNAVNVYWTPENTALTESNPTFGMMTLNTNKLTGLSKLSRELFADSRISMIDYINKVFTKAINKEEELVFMAGDGVGKPKGIRTYMITSAAQAGANIAADDIKTLYYDVPSEYREGAVFLLHGDIIEKLDKLKDTTGRYLWNDGITNGGAATLMGKPVLEMPDIPTNLGAGTNESEIYFGNLETYLIGDREEIGVDTTTVGAGAFENHQVAFKIWERIDGQLGLTDAWRKLTAVK
jgi:HK97 family phage major capsid protein